MSEASGNGNGDRPSSIPVAFPRDREGRRMLPEIVTYIPPGSTHEERAEILANALLCVGEHMRDMRDRVDTVELLCRQILQHLRAQ